MIFTSIGSAAFIYEVVAILGYLSFGKNVLGNIILECKLSSSPFFFCIRHITHLLCHVDPQSHFVAYGRLAIVILVIFSYPLQAHPCRASIDKILDHHKNRKYKLPNSLVPTPSNKRHLIVTTCIIIASYLVAITISQLDLVLSFVGSTGSTTISFILPGLFYFKIYSDDKWHWKRWAAFFLSVYGVLVMTICLTFNIMRLL